MTGDDPGGSSSRIDGIVVVTGIPGSGKTTLAGELAPMLELALISKDTIKEALFDTLGTGDLDWSGRLGRASHAVMYAMAAEARSAVLESFFWPGIAEPELMALGRPMVQVYCDCPLDLAIRRYRVRSLATDRHAGHLPEHQSDEAIARWAEVEPRPLALAWPLVTVDTTAPVDVGAVADRLRTVMASVGPPPSRS